MDYSNNMPYVGNYIKANIAQNASSQIDANYMQKTKSHVSELEQMPLAMGYVPYQMMGIVYEPSVAFSRGTLFPELDKPFLGMEAVNHG